MNHSSRSIGLPSLRELAVDLEGHRAAHVAEQVARRDLEGRVVAPLVRVADLGGELAELAQRLARACRRPSTAAATGCAGRPRRGWRRARPCAPWRAAGSAARRRAARRPRPATPRPGRRPASSARASPARPTGCGRRSRSSPRRRRPTGRGPARARTCHAQPVAPDLDRLLGQRRGHRAHVVGLADDDLVEGVRGRRRDPRASAPRRRRGAISVRPSRSTRRVGLHRVAVGHVVPVRRRRAGSRAP